MEFAMVVSAGNFNKTVSNRISSVIPDELKNTNQWVVYKLEPNEGGKPKKVPYSCKTGKRASVSNKRTGVSFENVIDYALSNKVNGIGFIFSDRDPYFGLDIDNCIDNNGEIEPWAKKWVKILNSYTEFSPSGKGLHVIGKGKLLQEGRRKGNFELYENNRYFTVTGDMLDGFTEIRDCTTALKKLQKELFPSNVSKTRKQVPTQNKTTNINSSSGSTNVGNNLAVEDFPKIATKSKKNGKRIEDLLNGEWEKLRKYKSQSEADLSLCSAMAFYFNKDPIKIDQAFRKSKLYRDKWNDNHIYRKSTIDLAIRGITGSCYRGEKQRAKSPRSGKCTVTKRIGKRKHRRMTRKLTLHQKVENEFHEHLLGKPCIASVILTFLKHTGASERLIYNVKKSLGICSKRICKKDLDYIDTIWYYPVDSELAKMMVCEILRK